MGEGTWDAEVLRQAVESGLRMQLHWGAPVAVVDAGGLQVHVLEEPGGHRFCVEHGDRCARPLREGVRPTASAAVTAAAAALVECLADVAAGCDGRPPAAKATQPGRQTACG